jgi:hypothetical protein
MAKGKGAMVWKLRSWKGGDPVQQAAHAKELGLSHVSIKIVDGRSEKWEGSVPNQNADLLPAAVAKLRSEGIGVTGWGWTYGGRYVAGVFVKDAGVARAEGELAAALCIRYAIGEFLIDAEAEFNRTGMVASAEAYMVAFEGRAPAVRHLLCSYRFPRTHQPSFPVDVFATYQEGWAPQVYWLGDNRPDGGAVQLERSKAQYDAIRPLPFYPVAPTYMAAGPWTASGEQLRMFFGRALALGCEGVSVWDLPQANAAQLAAIRDFVWPGGSPPPPPPPPAEPVPVEIRVPAGRIELTVTET